MTPQERQLVAELFDRLANLENSPRDPDAERLIAEAAKQAPHAVYALVQTALVQDEALKRANACIQELQAQPSSGDQQQEQQQGSFLDSMRDAVLGRRSSPGSVPTVRQQETQSTAAAATGYPPQAGYPPQTPAPGAAPQAPFPGAGPAFGSGGSFLGTAASTAAGVLGGAFLLDGIRSMFGHHGAVAGQNPSPFGSFSDQSQLRDDPSRASWIDNRGEDRGVAENQPSEQDAGVFESPDDAGAADKDDANFEDASDFSDEDSSLGEDDNDYDV